MCILSRMPPFWLIQLVHYCKWLVRVASLLAPKPYLLLSSALIGLDIFSCKNTNIDNNNSEIFFDASAMKATAWNAWNMLLHYQVQFKHIIWHTCFQWMSFQTFKHEYGQWNSLMCILSRMPPFWLIQLVHYCKWLVRVASLLAPKPYLLLSSALIGLDIFSCKNTNIDNNNSEIFFDASAMKATAWNAWNMLLHYQVQFKHIIWHTCFQWMSFQTFKHEYGQWNSLMCILSRMPPFWLIQLVHYCKWLVRVASLLAPKPYLLLSSALIGLDIFSCKNTNIDNNNSEIFFDASSMLFAACLQKN